MTKQITTSCHTIIDVDTIMSKQFVRVTIDKGTSTQRIFVLDEQQNLDLMAALQDARETLGVTQGP